MKVMTWLCFLAPLFAYSIPFEIVSKSRSADRSKKNLLMETKDYWIYKPDSAQVHDFDGLHYLNLYGLDRGIEELELYGELLAFKKADFALIRLDPKSAERLSSVQHSSGMYCGSIIQLDGSTVSPTITPPTPLIDSAIKLDSVVELTQNVQRENIRATVEELASYYNRYHTSTTGKQITPLLVEKYNNLKTGRSDVSVELYNHGSSTPQNSLVVRIPGSKYPDEIIVLGSHIDSIASLFFGAYFEAPGADDNASGTSTNLEIFRILMQAGAQFERTIEIHGYAAEEIGLVGSADMARRYAQDGKKVIAMMQIDMNLFAPEKQEVMWFISNGTNNTLNQHLAKLATQYLSIPHRFGPLYAGTSDHASWMRHGFAASFPTENPNAFNNNIHTIHDTIANSGNFAFAEEFAKLGIAFVHHFAGRI